MKTMSWMGALPLLIALGGCEGYLGQPAVGGYATDGAPATNVVPTDTTLVGDNYQPPYYQGNVVYYDDAGAPYYISNGATYYIEPTQPNYRFYVDHYRNHRADYDRWQERHRPRGDFQRVRHEMQEPRRIERDRPQLRRNDVRPAQQSRLPLRQRIDRRRER